MTGPVLVTGGLGFIGSAFVRRLAERGLDVVNVDAGTYAADERRLHGAGPGRVRTVVADVASGDLDGILRAAAPELVVHFAAETHVTRSESDPQAFFRTNVDGTRRVLAAAAAGGVRRVVHVSTDEVYGPCPGEPFRESDKPPGEGAATSAYARSKALADDVALGWDGPPDVVVARPANCFGPWQHPEKAIPRWATRALRGERLPVWGDGDQIRDWMYVDDACAAIELLAERGARGEAYNVAPEGEALANVDVARLVSLAAGAGEDAIYLTEYDRPQHDRRYAVDASRLRALGWRPSAPVVDRIEQTVSWYRDNEAWWRDRVDEAERLYRDAEERVGGRR